MKKLLKCYACFEDKIDFKPQAALILGSGLEIMLTQI